MPSYTSAPLRNTDPQPWIHQFAGSEVRSTRQRCMIGCPTSYAPRTSYDQQNLAGANPILAAFRKYSEIDADNVRALLDELAAMEGGYAIDTMLTAARDLARDCDMKGGYPLKFSYRHHARAVLERWQRVFA